MTETDLFSDDDFWPEPGDTLVMAPGVFLHYAHAFIELHDLEPRQAYVILVIDAVFTNQLNDPFLLQRDEIAKSCRMLPEHVNKLIDQLIERGYIVQDVVKDHYTLQIPEELLP